MNQFSGTEFEGTSISQLLNNQNNNNQPPLNPNFMVQNPPFYNPHVVTSQNNNMNNIQDLVNNINNNLHNNYNHDDRSLNNYSVESELDLDFIPPKKKSRKKVSKKKSNKKIKQKTDSKYYGLFDIKLTKDTKELLLIIFIYVLMSSSFVKKTMGQYISIINPNEFGKYSYISIILYGLILGVIFILLKKLIL